MSMKRILEKADRFLERHFEWVGKAVSDETARKLRYINLALYLVIVTMLLVKTCA